MDSERSAGHGYTCFICLKASSDSKVCSHCGAPVEEMDFSSAVLSPPKQGHFHVAFSQFSLEHIQTALEFAREKYFQSFEMKILEAGMQIRSNEIAFDRFIEALSYLTGDDENDLKGLIAFED